MTEHSCGAATSCVWFVISHRSRKPWSELFTSLVHLLDDVSRASALLLQILFDLVFSLNPEYVSLPQARQPLERASLVKRMDSKFLINVAKAIWELGIV